jgi:hypothetical protein
MSLDTILAIAGLAISIGGLVPLFFPQGRLREITLATIISALVLLSAVGAWREFERQAELGYLSNEVMKLLADKSRTIYQIEKELHHPSYPLLLETIDNLVHSGKIKYKPKDLFDNYHSAYLVGTYSIDGNE